MSKKSEPTGPRVINREGLSVFDESADCKNSILMRGWHVNYAEFERDGVKGVLMFFGDKIYLELDKYDGKGRRKESAKRYRIEIGGLIQELIGRAKA